MGEFSPIHWLIVLGFILFGYFFPSFVARGKRDFASILALNIFLGWTLVGWVVALVWALRQDSPTPKPDPERSGAIFCAGCGHYSPAPSKFCSSCGTQLAL